MSFPSPRPSEPPEILAASPPPSTPPRQPRIIAPPGQASPIRSPPLSPPISLQKSSNKKTPSKSSKFLGRFRSVFKSFPIISNPCKIPISLTGSRQHEVPIHGGTRMTGTLFGHRKSRINLAIQETPRNVPILVLELAIPTGKLLQDMGMGLVRIALECEKRPTEKTRLIDEPVWTMYCNGRNVGCAVNRKPSEEDLSIMQTLHAVSTGAGVLPKETAEQPDGELTYMRAQFQRVIGSRDSETFYMMNPDGNSGPELSIFLVRI